MVQQNDMKKHIKYSDLVYDNKIKVPKRFLFEFGDYKIAFHKSKSAFYHYAIWYNNQMIGYVDFDGPYSDIKTVMAIDTKILPEHQGKGIAQKVYETLVCDFNISIASGNQSKGAIKLWRKLAKNPNLIIYMINDYSDRFFDCDIFEISLNKKGVLQGNDHSGKTFNPYRRMGNLILVKQNGATNETIRRLIASNKERHTAYNNFKKIDMVFTKALGRRLQPSP